MGQLRGDLGLVHEHVNEFVVLAVAGKNLFDGDDLFKALVTFLFGLVHFGHAAAGDQAENGVIGDLFRGSRRRFRRSRRSLFLFRLFGNPQTRQGIFQLAADIFFDFFQLRSGRRGLRFLAQAIQLEADVVPALVKIQHPFPFLLPAGRRGGAFGNLCDPRLRLGLSGLFLNDLGLGLAGILEQRQEEIAALQ